ncbi:unnamed protein product [Arctia plantaginis]|uniref:Uncharacterized protein n=1 Tax=Arctia plantaginis TaxID=874455 RepID=A0A8S1B876_ARCPL|nr:unnamed protein product [Arctia plantaginis]
MAPGLTILTFDVKCHAMLSFSAPPCGGTRNCLVISCEIFLPQDAPSCAICVHLFSERGRAHRSVASHSFQPVRGGLVDSVSPVRVCNRCPSYRSVRGAALLYIPEAVPRLVFVDRQRDGRVAASAAVPGGLRSSDDV